MTRSLSTVFASLCLLLAGCATSSPSASPSTTTRAAPPAQVRCLGDPAPGAPDPGMRPLFFLFCVQSP